MEKRIKALSQLALMVAVIIVISYAIQFLKWLFNH